MSQAARRRKSKRAARPTGQRCRDCMPDRLAASLTYAFAEARAIN
jgi:hypothetical protein